MSVQTTLDAGSGARQGQADPDRCALALLGLNRDITFHRKHKLPNEAQPQARATLVTAFVTAVRPREPVEDLVPERGGDDMFAQKAQPSSFQFHRNPAGRSGSG